MTQEEKAKAYDEALKRARKINNGEGVAAPPDYTICETIFPELKESKDERIRKQLINFFSKGAEYDSSTNGIKDRNIIAWLEKQGEQKRLEYPYVTGWRENRPDNKPQIKHSVLMLTTHGVAEGEWLGKEWCQYRWSCKVKDTDVLYWLHLSDLKSLEKESEQKPIRPVWKYKKDNTPLLRDSFILNKYGCVAKSPSGALVSDVWVLDFDELAKLPKEEFERESEQKPTDKVELKFKSGNWYLCVKDFFGKGVRFDKGNAYYCKLDGCLQEFDSGAHIDIAEELYEYFRLWTIRDAKDGDVLANGNMVLIFKRFEEPSYRQYIIAYIGLDACGEIQVANGSWNLGLDNARPATKEQRDLLFQKMKEAGYEWDAVKKELNKIEQKPDFCHHEVDFSDCSEEYRKAYYDGWNNCNQQHAQLEAEQKSVWSEEDKYNLNWIIEDYEKASQTAISSAWNGRFKKIVDWLKSLKERYVWKPSESDILLLERIANGKYNPQDFQASLGGLIVQLKKLREE